MAWFNAYAKCVICDHKWVATYETGTDTDKLECPNCSNCSSEVSPHPRPEFEGIGRFDLDDDEGNQPT